MTLCRNWIKVVRKGNPPTPLLDWTMPISMGIICEKCGILYLIASKANNHHINCLPRIASPGLFTLKSSCRAVRSFHRGDLTPYSVSTPVYARGYAERGEYNLRQDLARISSRKPSS
jgi:hypothetical protein